MYVSVLPGVGISMVIVSALVGIYYNMVVAWSFLYLFTSMTSKLPWISCKNAWNTLCKLPKEEVPWWITRASLEEGVGVGGVPYSAMVPCLSLKRLFWAPV